MKSAKGGEFERQMSKDLSLWWNNGERDDVFWRTAMSGGRATVRGRQGKQTFGACGDIQAVDPVGQPLTRLCTIELKRGYTNTSFGDVLEIRETKTQQPWEMFVEQAMEAAQRARTPHWMLICKRDKRQAMLFIPRDFWKSLHQVSRCADEFEPEKIPTLLKGHVTIRSQQSKTRRVQIVLMRLDYFFKYVKPVMLERQLDHM